MGTQKTRLQRKNKTIKLSGYYRKNNEELIIMDAEEQVYNYENKEIPVPLPDKQKLSVSDYISQAKWFEEQMNYMKKKAVEEDKKEKNFTHKSETSKSNNTFLFLLLISIFNTLILIAILLLVK